MERWNSGMMRKELAALQPSIIPVKSKNKIHQTGTWSKTGGRNKK
jgi:hypothetical protein